MTPIFSFVRMSMVKAKQVRCPFFHLLVTRSVQPIALSLSASPLEVDQGVGHVQPHQHHAHLARARGPLLGIHGDTSAAREKFDCCQVSSELRWETSRSLGWTHGPQWVGDVFFFWQLLGCSEAVWSDLVLVCCDTHAWIGCDMNVVLCTCLVSKYIQSECA